MRASGPTSSSQASYHSFPPGRRKFIHSAARPLPNVTAGAGSRWGPRMATFPPVVEGLLGAFYRLPPLGGKLASEARLMRGLTVEGRGIFRPRARYFPGMESTQRSPGLRTRTRSARSDRAPNLFGAGINLGPFRSPPAAARAGQIRWSFFPHIAPLVCLAFSTPLEVAR